MTTVAVLGAGVAGLTCAHELVERNFKVVLIAPRETLGGKALSGKRVIRNLVGNAFAESPSAEHGFRFFPGFYEHLDDTMKRILIRSPLTRSLPVWDARSVFDCLVPIRTEILAATGKPLVQLPAAAPLSVNTVRTAIQLPVQLLDLGLTHEDLQAFADKMWQIATSCSDRRRKEYERIPWRDFIESPGRSDEYYWYLASGLTRGLVAARANVASTKTMGNLALRFLALLTGAAQTTDRVLCGPSDVVWIKPWLAHIDALAAQRPTPLEGGENFELRGSRVLNLSRGLQFAVTIEGERDPINADYVISALPIEELVTVLEASGLAHDEHFADVFAKLSELQKTCLRKMRGIQIYLKKDVPLNYGHQLYLDSPWALTSISQAQFWGKILCDENLPPEAKGVLSVDISSWDLPGLLNKKTAEEALASSPLEVFREVIAQIRAGLGSAAAMELFGPNESNVLGWHLDNGRHGLLVNDVGSWDLRPRKSIKNVPRFFLAGDFVRTQTDLACMEGANESARHAVNALLVEERERTNQSHPACRTFSPRRPAIFVPFEELDDYRYKKSLPWSGVEVGKWLLSGAQAGWTANDLLFAGQKADDPPLIGQDQKPIEVPKNVTEATSSLPREDRSTSEVDGGVRALTPQEVRVRLSADETAGRVDPMFQRWRAYSLTDASDSKAGEDFAPRMIPFHVYDADGLILYGRVHNFESLEKRMDRTGWRPVYANIGSRRVGFGELWIMSYNDTTTGPYNELVINFVATNDPTKPAYQWSSPYSVLVPMNDPANRLFTPLLLLDENRTDVPKKKREGGPIAYGNNLLGTKKESATIEISQKGTLRRFGCNTPDGAPVLTGHVDVNVSALDSFTATCEMVRQFGFIATGQAYDQRTSNAELSGGIVNPQGGDGKVREIIAAYKFAPKVGLLRPDRPERFGLHWEPGTKFGGILEECGFEPVIFGHDPHLKTVLSIDSWPSPDDVELAARDATTFTRESGMREAR